ncbi:MAG: 3-isopropylmalate dehydratase large subunit [Synergistaceae bacterium]|jgi:3-isopropylmalate/(R)-2-methylmalate dehydratase large subunit|nr:3-isopropylmalate dehydratase large subunit [Synergistaceae bacterium]
MNIAEKILARNSGRKTVRPGDVVVVNVESAVVLDMNFLIRGAFDTWPVRLFDNDRVIVINDHISPPKDIPTAESVRKSRQFAQKYGIRRFHDVGANQGIVHQVIADAGYALPGRVLVCNDSHTCSSGAFNNCARGIGLADLLYVLCKGETWFKVGETIRYDFTGTLPQYVSAKDVFLHIAGKYGAHVGQNIEFAGPAADSFSLDARKTLSAMSAELSAEFAIWLPNEELDRHMRTRTNRPYELTFPDNDAEYLEVRKINLSEIVPYVALPDSVPNNTVPVAQLEKDKICVNQCHVGSCANGTIEDIHAVAQILKGKKIAPHVRFIVTPASQEVYRESSKNGDINILIEAGCLLTPPACGVCGGLDFGVLAGDEVCLTASPRNFKGRMGSADAKIYLGSPAVVAASAVAGYITTPRR